MALIDGLVSYWKLDEASGTRYDSHGTNHLTDNNTVTQVAGKVGDAAHFVAANSEHLSIADNASLAFTTALSASFWINQTDLAANRTFIGKWTYNTGGEWAFQSQASGATGGISIYYALVVGDGGTRVEFATGMSAGVWYHVVVAFDGSLTGDANRMKLYCSNVQQTISAGTIPATLLNGSDPLYLGRFGGSLTRYYGGDMDEVGLWSRALTSTEVGELYNDGAGLAYPFSTSTQGARSMHQYRKRRAA